MTIRYDARDDNGHAMENSQPPTAKSAEPHVPEENESAFKFSWGMPSLAISVAALGILIIGWAGATQPPIATAGALAGIGGIAAFVCGFITRRLDAWAVAGLGLAILVLLAIPLAVDRVNSAQQPPPPPQNSGPLRFR
jgi:hypothetical protein